MKNNKLKAFLFINWLTQTLELQLLMTLVALPILIAWGLPFSYMAIISTPLFAPLFTLFLLTSCLLFFTQLLGIPNSYLIYSLEKISFLWLWIIKKHNYNWLIAVPKPSFILLFIPPAVLIFIFYSRFFNTRVKRISALCTILILFCTGLKRYARWHNAISINHIECHKGELTIISAHKKIVLVDPGFLGSKPVSSAWISYHLIPAITQLTGDLCIEHLVVLKLNQRTLEALQILTDKVPIKHIYIPFYTGTLNKQSAFILMKCKRNFLQQGGTWHSISKWPTAITIDKKNKITIASTDQSIAYQNALYNALEANGLIDNNPITIYPAGKRLEPTKGNR